MFATSSDILNFVIAACIVALTIFLCLALFYLIESVRKAHRVINAVEKGVIKAEEVISIARDKLKNGAAYLMLVGELAKKAFEMFSERQKKSSRYEDDDVKKTKTKKK